MKSEKGKSGRTSRRGFARQAASALVAVPALAAMNACAPNQGGNQNRGTGTTTTPSASPDRPAIRSNGDPPVIIDGGSVKIDSKGKFGSETNTTSGAFKFKRAFPNSPTVYKYISGIEVIYEIDSGFLSKTYPSQGEYNPASVLNISLKTSDDDDTQPDADLTPEFSFNGADSTLYYNDSIANDKSSYKDKRPNRLMLKELKKAGRDKKSVRLQYFEVKLNNQILDTGFVGMKFPNPSDPVNPFVVDSMRMMISFNK